MTQEEIMEMEKEAGARSEHWETRLFPAAQFLFAPDELSRFAAMVAAKEREACAQVCDSFDTGRRLTSDHKAEEMAAAIRARGVKEGA